jgi:hypothetical protein
MDLDLGPHAEQVKLFFENLLIDSEQIFEHVCGVNEVTHYTRPCLLCQPMVAKMKKPLVSVSILPATFPSDLEYEMIKMKPNQRSELLFGKQLVLVNDSHDIKRPFWIKEIILGLHTLGYQIFNPLPLYLAQTKHHISNQQESKKNLLKIQEQDYQMNRQKFVFLCWGNYDVNLLEKIILSCTNIASQIVLWINQIDKKEYLNKKPSWTDFENNTQNVFKIVFHSVGMIRKFQLMLLQREGRLSIENVLDYVNQEKNSEQMSVQFHAQKKYNVDQHKKLSFLY